MIVHIYYTRTDWHLILQDAIIPILHASMDRIRTWNIRFESKQGDHITISLAFFEESTFLEMDLLEQLAEYIKTRPSTTIPIKPPFRSFFMNFNNNTVMLSDENIFSEALYDRYSKYRMNLSNAIINALKDDVIDSESLLTLLIYLQLGYLKAKYSEVVDSYVFLINFKSYITNLNSGWVSNEKYLTPEKSDEENEDFICEIIDLVYLKGDLPIELVWLCEWINTCGEINIDEKNSDFQFLCKLICEHTGLDINRALALSTDIILRSFLKKMVASVK